MSTSDIQLVQNLIERCLQMYMSQKEVVNTLHGQAKIEPGFTGLVWQKLEEQNPQFFQAYYTRLKLKDQIVLFNHLLDQQVNIVSHCQNAWRQQQAQLAAQAAAAQQAQPGVSLQGMPGMQPAVSLPAPQPSGGGAAAAAVAPASTAPPPAAVPPHGDSGGFSGGAAGLATPDLADLGDMQVHGLSTSAAVASPPLFTGDSAAHLMGHGMPSSDNLVGLGHSPLHNAFPSASHDQGTAGDDIPRNFSMSDLMAMGTDLMDAGQQPQLDDADLDLGDGGGSGNAAG